MIALSSWPVIAACMLTEQPCEIANVPRIRDVDVLLELIEALGATVEGKGTGTLRIRCARVTSDQPDASSADEIATAKRLKGQAGAPEDREW